MKGGCMMNPQKSNEKKMTAREKWNIAAWTVAFAVIGAILGMIAYNRQWLG